MALEKGSTKIVHEVAEESFPAVRERIGKAVDPNAPEEIHQPYARLEQKLRRDNAKGARLLGPEGKLLEIKISKSVPEYPAISKQGQLRGVLTRIGGKGDWVPVHIEDVNGIVYICEAKKDKAKELASYYLAQPLVVNGLGRWHRTETGKWALESFRIHDFSPMDDVPIQDTLARIRGIEAEWSSTDYLATLNDLRYEKQ